MTISALTILVVALVVAAVVVLALWAYGTANRLDRLHVRSDLAWQALDAALGRRAVVVRAIAADSEPGLRRRLVTLADRAERADRAHRESAENDVSRALTAVDGDLLRPQLVAELADAEARVLIARRFHNDAVRDTLALRTRRLVGWLHLGGTAPLPTYFEIAERTVPPVTTPGATQATSQTPVAPHAVKRLSARLMLIDPEGRVLLLRGADRATPTNPFWFTVGGGVEPGESLRETAVRELAEETGKVVAAEELRGPVWRRTATFTWNGELLDSEEMFFTLATDGFDPHPAGLTDLERDVLSGHRWCTAEDIAQLDAAGETVYPRELGTRLDEVRVAATGDAEIVLRPVS
ncbi:NUDIX domain-containing protein [Rhodococcus sp. D2-41]|uniref:NUDIX hydrolase n=1 Tax=Speluncibacter jeojiensis TaxID=2710754 RepID=UPI00240EA78B|nr:NUDIX domain-containing protein [Rhodococcus sp. D2-41]MDG3011356.1 NUDIX domain-containing protein [Rhodococcus sp. D2-41]